MERLGIGPPDVQQLIIFPGPSTTASLVQSAGRLVRAVIDNRGEVFVHFTDHQRGQVSRHTSRRTRRTNRF